MPEGDTVWLAARRLHQALAGEVLTSSDFRVPQLATASLVGQSVLEVVPRGKHLLTRLSAGVTLHTHFRMDGSWHLYEPGDRWTGGPDWQVRVVLTTGTRVAVGYRLPVVELLATSAEDDAVGHLGPDVLDDAFDAQEAVRRLGADPRRDVGLALLDQRCLAGIGNLYRTEALFLSGVTPWTAVGEVDLPAVVDRAVRLMRANLLHPEQSTTGSLRRGQTHWVFERSGKPCLRCGSRVLSAEQGEPPYQRLTYWCGHCQRGPSPRSAGGR